MMWHQNRIIGAAKKADNIGSLLSISALNQHFLRNSSKLNLQINLTEKHKAKNMNQTEIIKGNEDQTTQKY